MGREGSLLGADADLLLAAGLAGGDFDGRFGAAQGLGQYLDALLVGGVVHGRGGEADFEGLVVAADDACSGGARLNGHPEGDALFVDLDFFVAGGGFEPPTFGL